MRLLIDNPSQPQSSNILLRTPNLLAYEVHRFSGEPAYEVKCRLLTFTHGVSKSSIWTQLVYIFIFRETLWLSTDLSFTSQCPFPQPSRKPSFIDQQLNDLGEWVLLFNPMNTYELDQWWGYDSLLINTLWVQNILLQTCVVDGPPHAGITWAPIFTISSTEYPIAVEKPIHGNLVWCKIEMKICTFHVDCHKWRRWEYLIYNFEK